MERKLIRQGDDALTMTLPRQWLRSHGLDAGKSVFLDVDGNRITVTAERTSVPSWIDVDLRGLERSAMFQRMLALYIEGYDVITVKHSDPMTINDISKELIGFTIQRHSSSSTVFKNLIVVPDEDLNSIMNRMRFMLLEQADSLVKLASGEDIMRRLKSEEKLLDNNILYCMRYIKKYEKSREAYRSFAKCIVFDLIADQLTEIAEYIGDDKELANRIKKVIDSYSSMAAKGSLDELNRSLRRFRNSIKPKRFVDGLAYSLAETMYNFVGYLIEKEEICG